MDNILFLDGAKKLIYVKMCDRYRRSSWVAKWPSWRPFYEEMLHVVMQYNCIYTYPFFLSFGRPNRSLLPRAPPLVFTPFPTYMFRPSTCSHKQENVNLIDSTNYTHAKTYTTHLSHAHACTCPTSFTIYACLVHIYLFALDKCK